jgi:pyruvate/2-oxoglutarate dehydrogenase complex dihydrolipoamide dehydrogenase (E3) component
MNAEVAIVGNGVAGYACATRLARHGIRPLLIGRGAVVDRPPLTKKGLAAGTPVLLADDARLATLGIDRLDAMVDEADLATGRFVAGETEVLAATVVLATGLAYRPPRLPGMEVAHVNANPRGMERLVAALAGGPKRVVVVGAGLIGTETSATLAVAGHDVTALDVLERPLDRLHDPLPAFAAAALAATGARFLGGAELVELRVGEHDLVTVCCKEGSLTADVIVAATGGRPFVPPGLDLEPAELPLLVGPDLRVPGFERVHAVGDLILAPHARFGAIRFPHWDMAIATGERAADAIAGIDGELDRLPYWWTDIGPRTFAEVGWADAAVEWHDEDGVQAGRDEAGEVVAALVVDDPLRLRAARALVGPGA